MPSHPVPMIRHEMPTGPQSAHMNHPPLHGVRIPSGEIFRHPHQVPDPIFLHHGGIPPYLGHPVGAMGLPPQTHIGNMSLGSMPSSNIPMNPMHPMLYDPNIAPRGSRSVPAQEPMLYGHGPHFRQFNHPAQSPYGPSRQLAGPAGRFVPQGQDMGSRNPRQPQQAYSGGMRGRPRKQSGRGTFTTYGGRKNSMPSSMDRPFLGNVDKSIPSGPIAEHIPHMPRRDSLSVRENVKPGMSADEVERFPDFDVIGVLEPNLPLKQQCHKKYIGEDVENMHTLWIGNISKGTPDEILKDLIEQLVPVKMVRPIQNEDVRHYCWTFVE
jgi:hypothetical protein